MLECRQSLFSHITSSNPLSKHHYIPVNNDRSEDNLKNYSVHPLSCYSRQHLSSANTIFFLKCRYTETDYRHGERDFPSSGSLPKCSHLLGLGSAKARSLELYPGLPCGSSSTTTFLWWSGASHGAHWQEAGVVSRAKAQTQELWYDRQASWVVVPSLLHQMPTPIKHGWKHCILKDHFHN